MQQIASDFVTQKRISTAMYGSLVACYLDLFSMYSRTNVSIYMYTCTQTLFQIWIDMGPDVQLPHGVAQPRQNSSKFFLHNILRLPLSTQEWSERLCEWDVQQILPGHFAGPVGADPGWKMLRMEVAEGGLKKTQRQFNWQQTGRF